MRIASRTTDNPIRCLIGVLIVASGVACSDGNVLVTDGGKISDAEWNPTERPGVYRWARIVELTHTTPPEKVFELTVKGEPPMGWHVYRADRIPSLYHN